jgi:hypothetical protein
MEIGGLLGVFLGGALPWLEAVVVIPAGILAGLDPLAVVLAGLVGNLLTVWLAAVYGERFRAWWNRRRRASAPRQSEPGADDQARVPGRRPGDSARGVRARRAFERWGMPGLAVLGPVGLGTQLSAVLAVSLGVTARRAFVWIGAGTAAWSVLAGALAATGATLVGVGAA